jgi:putative transposase
MMVDKLQHYQKHKEILYNTPSQYKHLIEFVEDIDSTALNNVGRQVFMDFHKHERSPSFKKNSDKVKSYKTNNNNNSIRFENGKIRLPKLKWVDCIPLSVIPKDMDLKFVTVSRNDKNKYFINIAYKSKQEVA